ncbi:hypothetical protein [Brevibacillus sp. NRS-1366]
MDMIESSKGPSPKQEITTGFCFFKGQIMQLEDANINISTHAQIFWKG